MKNIFEHYSAPKDSRKNNDTIMEKSRYARIDILKRFICEEVQAVGINYQPIADMLNITPELASGKTSQGIELTKKEKYRFALLSAFNSAAFAFQLLNAVSDELTVKVTSIESTIKLGLGTATLKESADKLKDSNPKISHMLECGIELINNLPK